MKKIMAVVAVVTLGMPGVGEARALEVVSLARVSQASPLACAPNDRSLVYEAYDPTVEREEEVSMAVDPTDPQRIVVVWLQDGGRAMLSATTDDGGATWHRGVVPGLTTCTGGDLDRVLHGRLVFSTDGTLFLASSPLDGFYPDPRSAIAHIAVSRSDDGGRTWALPQYLDAGGAPVFNDFDTIATEPDVPGAVDVVWSPTEGVLEPIVLSRSTDHGATWTHREILGPRPGQIPPVRLVAHPDGTLIAIVSDQSLPGFLGAPDARPLWTMRSADKGATWSAPAVVATGIIPDWAPAAVGPDGSMWMAWQVGTASGRELWLAESQDAGATWEAAEHAFTFVPSGTAGPQLVAGQDGSLALLYTRDGGAGKTEVVVARRDVDEEWTHTSVGSYSGLAYQGFLQGLGVSGEDLVAAIPLGAPFAERGVSDVFMARLRPA